MSVARAIIEELRSDAEAVEVLRAVLAAPEPDDLLTAEQAAERLKVTTRTVNRWAATGRLDAVRVGRFWRFPSTRLAPRPASGDDGVESVAPHRRRSATTLQQDVVAAIRGR